MESAFQRKYSLATNILAAVAECAQGKVVLVGGTALALFYLQHRVSVDLDFVPVSREDETKLKEALKGCLSKKGYTTQRARHPNQFIVQLNVTSVKVEVFVPERKVEKIEKRKVGEQEVLVASLDDLLEMKLLACSQRNKARDLFDIVAILMKTKRSLSLAEKLVQEHGIPEDVAELEQMVPDASVLTEFKKVIGR